MGHTRIFDARSTAAQVIVAVIQNQKSLSDILANTLQKAPADQSGLIHELIAGTLRWWLRLSLLIDQLLTKPLKPRDFDIYCLIAIGLYQIEFTRIPDYAAVSQTVNSTRGLNKRWAEKLINAILRNYLRQADSLKKRLTGNLTFQYSHPHWMVNMLQQDWPQQWQAILDANNTRPLLTLRVNTGNITVEKAIKALCAIDIKASKTQQSPVGLKINSKTHIWESELWGQGLFSVQDESAQLATYAVALSPGMRVLDACAAPGGKTCHLLELEPKLNLLALDKDASRMKRLEDNLKRLKLKCQTKVANATCLQTWWDNELYDLVIIDAPCSGSGVIRKHPDIKHLRHQTDIDQNLIIQRLLLDKLWSVLKVGGKLLYLTCSIFHQENDIQADLFLQDHKNARHISLTDYFGHNAGVGRQRLPGYYDSDGFYYVCFQKILS